MIRLSAGQLAQLKKKMNFFNRELRKAKTHNETVGNDYLNEYLPDEFNMEFFDQVINSEDEYYRWVDEDGILDKAKKKGIFDVLVSSNGEYKSRFSKEVVEENRQLRESERSRQTENLGTELYPGDEVVDVESMSDTEKATLYADNDLLPDNVGEPDLSVEDVDASTKAKWETEDAMREASRSSVSEKFYEYYGVWTSAASRHMQQTGGRIVADNLQWLYDNRPDVLEKMFNSNKDEMVVDYIYNTPKSKVYANIPYDDRHQNVVSYVTSKFNEVYKDTMREERRRKRKERDERLDEAEQEQRERIKRIRQIEKLQKEKGGFK